MPGRGAGVSRFENWTASRPSNQWEYKFRRPRSREWAPQLRQKSRCLQHGQFVFWGYLHLSRVSLPFHNRWPKALLSMCAESFTSSRVCPPVMAIAHSKGISLHKLKKPNQKKTSQIVQCESMMQELPSSTRHRRGWHLHLR